MAEPKPSEPQPRRPSPIVGIARETRAERRERLRREASGTQPKIRHLRVPREDTR